MQVPIKSRNQKASTLKLLSHRLRGFSHFEHTPSAMRAACASNLPFLEIDTRAGRDGRIYVYHDAKTGHDITSSCIFAQSSSSEIDRLRFVNGEPMLTLVKALDIFKVRKYKEQVLCIDIKDYGLEREHLSLIRDAGVEEHVCIISWIPKTLIGLYELGAKCPLIFSHYNLMEWQRFGKLITRLTENNLINLASYVLIGRKKVQAPLGNFDHGYYHALICQEMPIPLLDILVRSRGGISVPCNLMGARLSSYCRQNGLQLWLFSVRDIQNYEHYAQLEDVDVVFSDNALEVLRNFHQ